MIHLTLNQISAYIDAELPEASVELVRLHLSSCLECAERFGHIEEQEGALARLLVNEPGDLFFERFAERVLGPERVKKAEPVSRTEPPPRAAATAAPKEPARPRVAPRAPAPRPQPADPMTHDRPRKAGAARTLLTVATLVIVLSAAAVITLRPRIPRLSLAPTQRPAPLVAGGARDATPPRGPAAPSDAAPPVGAGGSDLLERAAARSSEADRAGTAEAHDAAAVAWEEALPELEKNADELAAGRREIASARYAAWSQDPTPERRDAATRAVRAYLLCAPAGADRDRAWTWLAELKR